MDTENPVCNDEARTDPDQPKASKSIMQSKEANGAVIAGGAGAIAVVQEVMPIIKEGGDMLSAMSGTALVCLVIMVAAGAIWYFRKQRLDEEGA
jgi:F0F1-type ATP synthase assembly protein I